MSKFPVALRFCKTPLAKDSPWKGLFCIEAAYSQRSNSCHSYCLVLRSYRWAKLCRVVVSVAVPIGFAMFLLVCFECLKHVFMVTVRLFSIFTVKKY